VVSNANPTVVTRMLGMKNYELSNHLGNVLQTVTDRKLPVLSSNLAEIKYYTAEVVSYSDYYPFGMTMVGRNGNAGDQYNRGFNGEIKDDDIKGEGNSYDYGNRFYDPRLGKFLSLDGYASKYPSVSPYSFALNSPIRSKDVGGDSVLFYSESGIYLGYSHDNVRYKDKNLLVVVNDKDVKTFKKEYDRKRSAAYQKKNKLSDNQVEQHVAGLEAMGLSFDVTSIVKFDVKTKAKKITDPDGFPVEFYTTQKIDKSNPLDKGGSIGVDTENAKPGGKDAGTFPENENPELGDAHSHTDDLSMQPTFGDNMHSQGQWSIIVSGNFINIHSYKRIIEGGSLIDIERKSVQMDIRKFKESKKPQ
jgi:RHS repeat-associated protein